MEKLPPIPTPLKTQWREFRYAYLPYMTFAILILLVGIMWRNYVTPPSVLAQVEPVTANVISTQPGLLVTLDVERFQRVTNGQEIGQLLVLETNVLAANLEAIAGDLQVKQANIELLTTRDSTSYERERLTYLQEVVAQNKNKKLLARYQADFLRASNLWLVAKPPLISEAQYDAALALYEQYRVDVEETAVYLAEKEKSLPKLRIDSSNMLYVISQDIKAQQDSLKASGQNVVLRSPIDGTISLVRHQLGERITAGDPVVVITPLTSDRIIAYVRQPMNTLPKMDDWVQVRRQTFKREVGYGKVVQVGTQLERIDPALLAAIGTGAKIIDMGLPFLVKLRDKMNLAPGERVDIMLKPQMKDLPN